MVRLGRTADATINGRHLAAAASAVAAVLLLFAPGAAALGPAGPAFVPQELLDAAAAHPDQIYRVIVQGTPSQPVTTVEAGVKESMTTAPATGDSVNGAFSSIPAVAAELTGEQIELLASDPGIFAITPDMPLRASVTDPPTALEPPTVTGAAQSGATLSASPGQWSGAQVDTAYQWQRCDASSTCTDIPGATATTYDVTADDVGSTIQVVVTATNVDGSATSTSAPTAAVDAPVPVPQIVPAYAVVRPSITGTPAVGDKLNADDGVWSGTSPISLQRQWQRCSAAGDACLDIPGATDSTYVVVADDAGSTLHVVVTATDAYGTGLAPSDPTAVVSGTAATGTLQPPNAVSPPTVTGTPTVGESLTAYDGTWSGVPEITRRWQRCSADGGTCLDIAGATDPTYVLAAEDAGFTVRIVVTATDAGGSTAVASDPTLLVAAPDPSAPPPADPLQPSTSPSVTGTPIEGQTLTADDGQWAAGVQIQRSWQRCDASGANCSDIVGPTGPQYALTATDVGYTVRVVVTASDGSASATAASIPTGAVAPAPPPPPTGGGTSTATVAPSGGGSGTGSTPGGSGSTPGGSTVSAGTTTGGASIAVNGTPPVNVTLPSISGDPAVRGTLVASHGAWATDDDHPDYSYRWQRCSTTTGLCTTVQSWSRYYTPSAADVGSTIQVLVTVDDNGDHASATSSPTDRVAPYSPSGYFNWQLGPYAAKVDSEWTSVAAGATKPPAIAIVDSGVDGALPGLDGSVVQQVPLTTLPQGPAADGYGHGSFVAQVAAGHARGAAGASPTAPIVSLDVMNDDGMALTSDVVAAADWIYTHKDADHIGVANFSLIGSSPSSIMFDPLDRALERLWFSGVVVVTAAGNFAVDGQQSNEPFAPANDPFAITVGASDTTNTLTTADDTAAPWSAYGHTFDGFEKPELGAPGRYVVASVPTDSTLYQQRPDRVVAPGQLELSGTSFAAPMISGIAANLLALHPSWTPDQVKGALMLSAAQPAAGAGFALGVGVLDADAAAAVTDPPNPNAALEQFVVPDPTDGAAKVFDTASWGTTAQADASWGTASWGTASWGTASWGTASWGTTYWSSASWGTASWGTASWGTASWGTASWGTDNALADLLPGGGYPMNFG